MLKHVEIFTCIVESPIINFAPSITAIYENLSWSGVWISPIRYFLISSNTFLISTENGSFFSICKEGYIESVTGTDKDKI